MKLKLVVKSLDEVEEAVRALYAKQDDGSFKLDVDGVPDVTKLTGALAKEREAREAAEKQAKAFDGMNADEVKALLAKFEGDEEHQLIKAGKFEEVINKRTEKMRTEYERKLKAAEDVVANEKARAGKWTGRVLDNAIRDAASKAGIHQHAIDDALFRGRSLFALDDDGNAVQLGQDGKPVLGKDGKSVFSPTEWLDTMRESAPHWFPAAASGGGAQNNNSVGKLTSGGMVRSDDMVGFGRNLEGIANGTVKVVSG